MALPEEAEGCINQKTTPVFAELRSVYFTQPFFQPMKTKTAMIVMDMPIRLAASMVTSLETTKNGSDKDNPYAPVNSIELGGIGNDCTCKQCDTSGVNSDSRRKMQEE